MRSYLIILMCLLSSTALAQRNITAIEVNYAAPEQLMAVIKPYLSEGSTISRYQNQLILNVTPQELQKTRKLLEQLDMAGRQLLISVRTGNASSNTRRAVDVDSVIRLGDTIITNGSGGGRGEPGTTVRVENSHGSSAEKGNQSVRATEGMPAYIATGLSAPTQNYTIDRSGNRYTQQEYISALSGFYATTWLNDNAVRITIDQSNDQFKGQTITTQQLRSEVSGALGQWLSLGEIDSTGRHQDSGVGSRGQASQSSSTELFIKVDTVD